MEGKDRERAGKRKGSEDHDVWRGGGIMVMMEAKREFDLLETKAEAASMCLSNT